MSNKKFYITTPIYYPSASPHLGHAYCTTMCDVIARGKKLRGYDTYFLTGTDEHGEKIQKNAEAAGITPQEFVDNVAKRFVDLWKAMGIANDDFIRTTQPRHVETVKKIFTKFVENDDVYLGSYEGWYCVHEESYWTETQVGPEHLCPECGRPVEKKAEPCYFYRCSKHVQDLLKFYDENPDFITPVSRKNEMINTFIKPGLNDLCVSRTTFNWGIQIPQNPEHVIYVWLDALSNYITALGYDQDDDSKFQRYWNDPDTEIVHVVGNDITRFHTIYWPMFLKSLNLREPNRVFVHGLMMMKDGKMSKSKGNAISAYPLIERYGVDAVRYYMVSEITFGTDGTFTPEMFVDRVNSDLANNIGNLLNRTVSMINKYFDGIVPEYKGDYNELAADVRGVTEKTIKAYEALNDDLKVTEAYAEVMNMVSRANKYIEESVPWALAKDETKRDELAAVMSNLANVIYTAGVLLSPIFVEKSEKIFDQLGVPAELRNYESIQKFGAIGNVKVNKGEQLFPRLDVAAEVEYITGLMAGPKEKAAA
ncbi:MAG: methionine--tRNA ligase [Bacilli bacterium]|nr:methionine--tRNA ligase [Bacilli bacterium]